MKRINTIIESNTPPHGKNTLWLKSKENGSKELIYNGDKVGSDLDKIDIFYTRFPLPNPAFLAFMSYSDTFVPFSINIECSGESELVRTAWNLRDCLYYNSSAIWYGAANSLVDSDYIEDIITFLDKTGEIDPYFNSMAFSCINCNMEAKVKDSDEYLIKNLTHPILLPCMYGWVSDEINSWGKYTINYKGDGKLWVGYH